MTFDYSFTVCWALAASHWLIKTIFFQENDYQKWDPERIVIETVCASVVLDILLAGSEIFHRIRLHYKRRGETQLTSYEMARPEPSSWLWKKKWINNIFSPKKHMLILKIKGALRGWMGAYVRAWNKRLRRKKWDWPRTENVSSINLIKMINPFAAKIVRKFYFLKQISGPVLFFFSPLSIIYDILIFPCFRCFKIEIYIFQRILALVGFIIEQSEIREK